MSVGVANWQAAHLFPTKAGMMWKSFGGPQEYFGQENGRRMG